MGRTAAPWRLRLVAACVLSGLALAGGAAAAAEGDVQPGAPAPEVLTLAEAARLLRVTVEDVEALAWRQRIPARRIGGKWRFSRAALLRWLAGEDAAPVARGNASAPLAAEGPGRPATAAPSTPVPDPGLETGDPFAPPELARVTGRGPSQAQAAPEATPGEAPIGERPEERSAEEVFLRGQSVLLRQGEVTLELSQLYSRSDDQEVTLLGSGVPVLATREDEVFTSLGTVRYGLFDDTQTFASLPLRHERASLVVGDTKFSDTRTEFGDVRAGVRHALVRERSGLPEIILTAEGRVPTGKSSYAVGGGVALIKSLDPAALFAGANYLRTFSRDFDDVTRLQPEETVDFTLGYALALNDTLSISTALSGLFTSETSFPNATLRQQELFSLQFSLTSLVADSLYVEPLVSFGLNGTGSRFVVGVSVPYTFAP